MQNFASRNLVIGWSITL